MIEVVAFPVRLLVQCLSSDKGEQKFSIFNI